jgi:putative drug exporter of the RND superfamily
MLYRLGIQMVRFRWLVIGTWVAAFLVAVVLAPKAISNLSGGFGQANTESRQALDLLEAKLGLQESAMIIVFTHDELTANNPEYRQAVETTLAHLSARPEVAEVFTAYTSSSPGLISDDGRTSYAMVTLKGTIDEALDNYADLRNGLRTPEGFQMWGTGGIAIFSDLNQVSEKDLQRAERISFPLVLIALALVFGTLVAAGLPVAMAGLSVTMTLALVFLLSQVTDMSVFVLNIASFLGIGMAIDYTLLIVNRFREELPHRPRDEAVGITMTTAGRAILFSGLTSVLGLSGLLLFPYMVLRSMGIGGVSVILLSMLLAMTLVPAILGVVGPGINSLSVVRVIPSPRGVWSRLAWGVMRHPLLVALPIMMGLLLLGMPFLDAKIGAPWASILPEGTESRDGWEVAERDLGAGELSPMVIAARAPGSVLEPDAISALYDYTRRLQTKPGVRRVESIVTLNAAPSLSLEQYLAAYSNPDLISSPEIRDELADLAADDTTVISIFTDFAPVSDEAKAFVRELRAEPIGDSFTTLVTGATADLMDANDTMYRYFPLVILYVVATIYVVLLLLFRSVVLPLKAVVMNAMSIFASYGALVFIFQQGHFEGILGFTAHGSLETTVPIILFCILFGLSMDYEVFLLSRIKEVYDETGENTESVAMGLERTGRIITSAAGILVLVAGAFVTSDVLVIKALGLGIAIAVLLDTTVVRALLVPALMRIMGDWNWWAPRFLLRVLPQQRFTG